MPGAEKEEGRRRRVKEEEEGQSGGFSQSFVQSQLKWRFFLPLRRL